MTEKIFVIGHKSPDLDSVAAAISYANLKNLLEKTDRYVPAVAGEVNGETKYCLDKFEYKTPEVLGNAQNNNVIIVDHNEFSQAVDGMNEAKIIEILDHHKVDFKYSEPIAFKVLPWGASCSIIANEYFDHSLAPDKNLAGLMLAAVLVDTVITKSPTCTNKDKEIIEKLAGLAGIVNWQAFGMEVFKIRSNVSALTTEKIIKSDFKDFNLSAGKFGVGQVETVDLSEFSGREEEILTELKRIKNEGGYHSVILFITDIIKEGSEFLVATSDEEKVSAALGQKLENGRVYVPGIISRKKQVAPKFTEVFGA